MESKTSPQNVFRIVKLVFQHARKATIAKFMQLALSVLFTPLSIFFTQKLIDAIAQHLNESQSWNTIILYIAALILCLFFISANGFLSNVISISMRRALNENLTPNILNKFQRLAYSCFEDSIFHDIIQKMKEDPQDNLMQLFNNLLDVATAFFTILGSAIIFSQASVWLTIGYIMLLAPMIWFDYKSGRTMGNLLDYLAKDERYMHYLGGLLTNKNSVFDLRLFGAVDYLLGKWAMKNEYIQKQRVKATIRAQHYFLLSTIFMKTWSFVLIFGLIASVASGRVSIGLFTALIASTGIVLANAERLSQTMQSVIKQILLVRYYDEFLLLPEMCDIENLAAINRPRIIFDNVTFAYPNTNENVLNGVSFVIEPNEHVALVGENGAGKSTIIKLLCGLYPPNSGHILINDIDIAELSQAQLQEMFSVVFQDFCCYQLTLRENIAFGDINQLNNDNAIQEALQKGFTEEKFEENLDLTLGKILENGVDLSRGQWQRVAIGRACLARSDFLILDEPTASLDPIAESNLYNSFLRIMKNQGTIMVSHRLASAKMSDKIVVLKDGIVESCGSHQELLMREGLYADMWKSQSSWYQAEVGI